MKISEFCWKTWNWVFRIQELSFSILLKKQACDWIKLRKDRWCQHDVNETTVQLDERFCDVGAFDHSEAFKSLNADRELSQHLNSHQTYGYAAAQWWHYSKTKPDPRTLELPKSFLEYDVSYFTSFRRKVSSNQERIPFYWVMVKSVKCLTNWHTIS